MEEEEGEESGVKEEVGIAGEEHHTEAIVINKSVLLRIPPRNPLRGPQNQVSCYLIRYLLKNAVLFPIKSANVIAQFNLI